MTMTDPDLHDDDLDLDDDDTGDDSPLVKKLRRQLKAANKKAAQVDELNAKVTQLEQGNVVRSADLKTPDGKALSDKQVSALLKVHDGELTPEALRATAVDLGFAAPPEPAVPPEELDTHQRVAEASAGAGAAAKVDPRSELDAIDPNLPRDEAARQIEAWANRHGVRTSLDTREPGQALT